MIYQWKLPGMYNVPAQDAGEELERIYQERGRMDAADIVDESRPEDAVLHPCFEWRDPVAAELWREHQARGICQCIVTAPEEQEKAPVQIRAFVHVAGTYHPTEIVVSDEEKYSELLQNALRDFKACREKYTSLSNRIELQAIFSAIDTATA